MIHESNTNTRSCKERYIALPVVPTDQNASKVSMTLSMFQSLDRDNLSYDESLRHSKDRHAWVDADIRGCFNEIAHAPLLAKLQTFPAMRRPIKAWLEAGVMEDGGYSPTESGAQQGSVVSPLLANIALHGMEREMNQLLGPYSKSPHLIRYADDLVVFHATLEGVLLARQRLEQWLAEMGLELKPSKTRITHTLHPHEGQVGFDLLGVTVRQYPVGATHTRHTQHGEPLGCKTLITPSKEAIKRHCKRLGDLVRANRSVSQRDLIGILNPVILGWANYYRSVVSAQVFNACDHMLIALLLRWTKRRHARKPWNWVFRRYWSPTPTRKWNFATADGASLWWHTKTKVRRHVKVKGTASPFDGHLVYWSQRLKAHPLTGFLLGQLLQAQQGRCRWCHHYFLEHEAIEIDHIVPRILGGTDAFINRQALHRHCHDQKSAMDGSQWKAPCP